ncbi:MAG: DUF4143 domain-containing protein, partial [Deltaproteobacteria bacterium]|nr:DUF4143 domain-containing protein [Deltaproteobacteria bacterium]
RVYWWRTSHGQEVDFIVEREGKIQPIEVKMTSRINRTLIKSLESFCELFPDEIDKGYLVSLAPEKVKMGDKIEIQPFKDFIVQLNS